MKILLIRAGVGALLCLLVTAGLVVAYPKEPVVEITPERYVPAPPLPLPPCDLITDGAMIPCASERKPCGQ